jgi:hypothetical protein
MPAVLDIKWYYILSHLSPTGLTACRCHRSPSTAAVLGIADSEGNIALHEWQVEQVEARLESLFSCVFIFTVSEL